MTDCGGYCCESGDTCAGGGSCQPQDCNGGEVSCGGGSCCPSGTRCAGGGSCELEDEAGSGGFAGADSNDSNAGSPAGASGGFSSGDCDEALIRAQLGSFSSGNGCVDGCISSAVHCAGVAGCVLTSACQNAEISCVQSCF